LEKVKDAINKVLPIGAKRTAATEAMWEDGPEQDALNRELRMQGER